MAIVAPFMGLTYNFNKIGNLGDLITPPYDVITKEEQEGYYQAHPNNIIRLELGNKKKGDSDWDNRYTRAADYIKRWESEDILIQADQNSIYLTSHSYDPGNGEGTRIRWGFISLVKIEDEGSGVILPHERTFSAHKDDRLKLLRACFTQLSQVFGLYDGADKGILKELKKFIDEPPVVSFEFKDGTGHKMWQITDTGTIKKVIDAMADKSIFIADGHHRYETSRNYRNLMRARHGKGPNKQYEYVMMYLTDMGDHGLTILPSHRLVKKCVGFESDNFLKKIDNWFRVEKMHMPVNGKESYIGAIKKALESREKENTSFVFHCSKNNGYYLLTLRNGIMDQEGENLHPALRELDVIVLSRLIFQKSLGFTKDDLDNDSLFHYNSNTASTISLVDSGKYEMAFLLNPTKIEQVQEIARNSLIMPRKSTYFFPKVLTGLVFNKIDPDGTIKIS
ncbi:DUF1015 domain-containing protein [Thermodesulfobacteriota bacterium]